jgi:hypothetical protein
MEHFASITLRLILLLTVVVGVFVLALEYGISSLDLQVEQRLVGSATTNPLQAIIVPCISGRKYDGLGNCHS